MYYVKGGKKGVKKKINKKQVMEVIACALRVQCKVEGLINKKFPLCSDGNSLCVCGSKDFSQDSVCHKCGADPLDLVELIMWLEQYFSILIPDEEFLTNTIEDAVKIVLSKTH